VRRCAHCGTAGNPVGALTCRSCGRPLAAATRESRKKVTSLFADIAGSTALGERLDPEAFRQVIRAFFEVMASVVDANGGSVENFIGDEITAAFGVPVAREDDALRAVRAAIQMRDALARLNEDLEVQWGVRLRMRVGANTGTVLAGAPIAGRPMLIGDAINVAARLVKAAGPDEILIGEETYRLARRDVEAHPVGPLALRGKEEQIRAFRVERVGGDTGDVPLLDRPIIGRARELALLTVVFERAVARRSCEFATVLGEPGVGKSRLVAEMLARRSSNARVLVGRCLPYGDGLTYWPLSEIVKQAAGIEDADTPEEARGRLAALLGDDADAPAVAGHLAQIVGLDDDGEPGENAFWAARRLLEILAAREPLVVVFEDVQWAEPTFLELVEHIPRWARLGLPLVIVCTARFELLDRRPEWAELAGATIHLEPLSGADAAELVEQLVGPALAPEARTRIAGMAAGNPLFVEQVVSMLIDDGTLRRVDGEWVPAGDVSVPSVPPSIEAILAARIDHLAEGERAAAECAAVIGREFALDALAELAGQAVTAPLKGLRRKQLVERAGRPGTGEELYRFRHLLLRDAVYDAVPKARRSELHERFAGWLERRAGARLAEIGELAGYHLEAAHRYRADLVAADARTSELAKRAADHLAAAGRRATARQDDAAAVGLLARAVALLAEGTATRFEPLIDLGTALLRGGDYARAEAVLAEARANARAAGDARGEASLSILQLNLRRLTDPPWWSEHARREAERVIRTFQELGDDAGAARAWHLLGKVHSDRGQQAASQEAMEQALEYARRAGDAGIEAWARFWLLQASVFGPTPVERVIARGRDDLDWARARGNRSLEGSTLGRLGEMLARAGRIAEAGAAFERARSLFAELGQPVHEAYLAISTAAVEPLVSDPPAAERELRRSFELFERIGGKGIQATVAPMLAAALVPQGRSDEALGLTELAEEIAAPDDLDGQVKWRCARAAALAAREDLATAETLAREAVALAAQSDTVILHGDALLALGRVLAADGRTGDAVHTIEAAVRLYEAKGDRVSAAKGRALLDSLSGAASDLVG
jgi:class 3 adenylate cyclase/tetratricopeptide (TPR) repeat protein